MHHRLPKLASLLFLYTALVPLTTTTAHAEIVVHETFADESITDSQPARWDLACFKTTCKGGEATYAQLPDGFQVEFNRQFAMWRLTSVEGQELAPSNQWSIRARIEPVFRREHEVMVVGVGLDTYYWGAYTLHNNETDVTDVNVGREVDAAFNDSILLPLYSEKFIQLDVYPNRMDAYIWEVDNPSTVIHAAWEGRPNPVQPGLPVFWGNLGGEAIFREVLVSTEYLGTGGDFDRNGQLDSLDVTALMAAIRSDLTQPIYNLTSDTSVDEADLTRWVHGARKTYFGDANLDGQFDSDDLITVFAAGQYQDTVEDNSAWQDGDWNADGDFDSGDLIVAFQDGGYLQGPRTTAPAAPTVVPEPAAGALVWFVLFSLVGRATRTRPLN